ncbi:PREDICTED: odorant receptor 13a-like [Eufriesea mexicana]|uniref:odorant receptor 13a-like n=1 Tax=Eufriesea mexicana TaxID=516756 RepID=UPI00083C2D62|nr:PREDICTED: odorant receptor 13a-like [Eufriesea mexicana]
MWPNTVYHTAMDSRHLSNHVAPLPVFLIDPAILNTRYLFLISSTAQAGLNVSTPIAKPPLSPTTDNRRRLPYFTVIDIQETPWYEMAYVFQIVIMMNVTCTFVTIDTIGPMFIFVTCGYLETIRRRIESFRFFDQRSFAFSAAATTFELEYTKDLRTCVICHRLLLEFCQTIERFTNFIFLIQLLGSTYNISLIGFKLFENSPDKIKYVTQLLLFMTQLLLCNWPADVLSSKSEDIASAAYSIPWYRYPYNAKILTSMLIIRSQRPVRLTAGKFVQLSLETFASMISAAVSFFTMIRGIN